jgi:hypothetical protein
MGLEHLGVVIGEAFDEFSRMHRAALTAQQFQSADVDPVYVLFEVVARSFDGTRCRERPFMRSQ